jgi:glycosyltransferase involved in cell wall biosynthesis
VATRGGAFPEIVEDGVTGLLVDPGDAAGLARALLSLLEDMDAARAMGRAARERARQRFGWDRRIGEWLGLYDELVRDGRGGPARPS